MEKEPGIEFKYNHLILQMGKLKSSSGGAVSIPMVNQ